MKLSHFDRKDSLGLKSRGYYEPWETSIVQRDVKLGDVFVDVGAHIGYYTVMASELVGPTGKVYAFEPAAKNFRILKSNVAGLGNVQAAALAISSEDGERELWLGPSNSGDNRLVRQKEAKKSETVKVSRLDFLVPDIAAVSFVKIDTQGHELEVLMGMREILFASRRLKLLIEYAPSLLVIAGHKPEDLLGILRQFGFSFRSSRTHDWRLCTAENGRHSNLYCVREK